MFCNFIVPSFRAELGICSDIPMIRSHHIPEDKDVGSVCPGWNSALCWLVVDEDCLTIIIE